MAPTTMGLLYVQSPIVTMSKLASNFLDKQKYESRFLLLNFVHRSTKHLCCNIHPRKQIASDWSWYNPSRLVELNYKQLLELDG